MIGSNISMCIDFYHQPHLDFHRRTPIIPLNIKTSETAMTNLAENIKITPTGGPLGAEVSGIDFSAPVDNSTATALNAAWSEHLVLLFRDQDISDAEHIAASALFGEPAVGASRSYYEKSGIPPGNNVVKHPEIAVISNLGPDGVPVMENDGLGSGEVVWHSDNSYIETPPAGSFLRALEVPPKGGSTSFTNQYLAYETLPDDVKTRITGLYTKQDSTRNSAGVLRPGVTAPKTLADVPGPDHPLVRLHSVTGRKALYLGRRRVFPSQFIIGWDRAESEDLLNFLWNHATQVKFEWGHDDWRPGDMLLWDNRCVMHHRDPHAGTHRRIMHRTQLGREKPIAA
jgi:taurine dioxygenase